VTPRARALRLAALGCALSLGGTGLNVFQPWQAGWLDFQFQFREALRSNEQRKALRSTDIALVKVDEASLEGLPHSPLSRRLLAQVVRQLKAAGARTILLDVLLDIPAPDDDELLDAIRAAGNVILPATVSGRGRQVRLKPPQRQFIEASAGFAPAVLNDDEDKFIRRLHPMLRFGGRAWPYFALSGAAHFQRRPALEVAAEFERRWAAPGHRWLTSDSAVLIDYIGSDLSAEDSLMGWQAFSAKRVATGWLNPFFADKLVIVGNTITKADVFSVPLTVDFGIRRPREWFGLEILAQVANMQLSGHGLRMLPLPVLAVLLFGAVLPLTVLTLDRGVLTGIVIASLTSMLAVAVSLFGFCKLSVVVDAAVPLTTFSATFALAAYVRRTEELQRKAVEAERSDAERRKLAELAQQRDLVLKMIVHDLKVPIAIIKGEALTLLQDTRGMLGEEIRQEFLETMALQCDRLNDEIEDLLDSDPNRQIALRLSAVDLRALTAEVVERQKVYAHKHELRLQCDEADTTLPADKAKLQRVLTNLINNAVKYSPEGGVVEVAIRRVNEQFEVNVQDQGIGMTPAQRARLFGLFERVLDPRHNIPGTGVGLFSVKRLVEAHGGTIEVESEPDRGSRFSFRLPMEHAAP